MWMPLARADARARLASSPPSAAVIGAQAPVALTIAVVVMRPVRPLRRSRQRTATTSPLSGLRSIDSMVVPTWIFAPRSRASRGVGRAQARAVDPPLVEGHPALEIPAQARLERVQLVGGEARVRLAALERLELVVRLKEPRPSG
jgi:hypothetical protein